MALIDMVWNKISIHNVVSEFLRGERNNFSFYPPWTTVIDNPNLDDPVENHKRLRLFYIKRGKFMVEIPPDTQWWEVASLSENELDELYLSARHTQPWSGKKLAAAASAFGEPLTSQPREWPGRIILWGHDRKGPFSIIEGNHRMLAYACAAIPRPPLNIPVYVGLSSSYCWWHYADPPIWLGHDLYKPTIQCGLANNWLACA
jgi:hypothetical protein